MIVTLIFFTVLCVFFKKFKDTFHFYYNKHVILNIWKKQQTCYLLK